eukprot:symbB.v1.2.016363.t1/scaffold1243.1/size129491/5
MAKDMLSMGDPIMRRLATAALSHLGQGEALKHCQDFVHALKDHEAPRSLMFDQDRGVRYSAVVYLAFARSFSGPSPVQEHTAEVAELLQDEDPGIRYWAIETLANQGFASQPQSEKLHAALEDIDPHCRLAAAKAVARVTPDYIPKAAACLVQSLDPEEPKIFRKCAAEGLGYMGQEAMKYLPRLVQVLQDSYPLARASAAWAIGHIGPEAVQKCCNDLAKCLEDPDLDVRTKTSSSLQSLDIATALSSVEPALRCWGAAKAAEVPEKGLEHIEALAQLLQDHSKEVRAKAALAMSAMGHAAAQYMALVTLAVKASHGCTASMLLWMTACCSQDENPEVWPPVLRIISRHLPEALTEALTEMSTHVAEGDPQRRCCAIQAMGAARDAALPFLDAVAACLEESQKSAKAISGPSINFFCHGCVSEHMNAGALDGLVPKAWKPAPMTPLHAPLHAPLVPTSIPIVAPIQPMMSPMPMSPVPMPPGFQPPRLPGAQAPQAEMQMVELLLQDAECRSREARLLLSSIHSSSSYEARQLRLQCQELHAELQQQRMLSSPKSPALQPLRRPPLDGSRHSAFAEAKQLELRQQREKLQQQLCDLLQQFSEMRVEQEVLCEGGYPSSSSSRRRTGATGASPFRLFPPPRPEGRVRRSSVGSNGRHAGTARRSVRPSVAQGTPQRLLHGGQGLPKGMSRDTSDEGDRCTSHGSTVTGHRTGPEDEGSSPDTKLSAALHPKAVEAPELAEASNLDELLQLISSGSPAVQCCDAELGQEEAPSLGEVLRASSLEVLILASNELGAGGIDVLASVLPTCHHLRPDVGKQTFHPVPRHLDLSWNQLGPTGAFSLAAQLPKMHLRQLELSSNQLEAAGAKALAVALAEDRHLVTLDLSWNSMGDEGGIAIAQMLSTNRTLQHLNLAINDLTWPSAAALRQVVQGHPSLQELDLAGNDIPEDQHFLACVDKNVDVRLASMEALHCAGKRGVRKGDKILAKLAKTDPDSQVRREALGLLRHYMIAGKFGLDNLF